MPCRKTCLLKILTDILELVFPLGIKKPTGFIEAFYFPPCSASFETEGKSVVEFLIGLQVVFDTRKAVLHFIPVMIMRRRRNETIEFVWAIRDATQALKSTQCTLLFVLFLDRNRYMNVWASGNFLESRYGFHFSALKDLY